MTNLLMVTKANTDGVHLQKQETVLEELIDSTLVKFKKHYPEQVVDTCIPEDFISIPMDAMLIQQVLLNLLENAVIHASGMTQLWLTVKIKGKQAVFSVRDNGCGIPPKQLDMLFTGHSIADDRPADSQKKNAGIGLSVCAAIIKAHGGIIEAENIKTGGAVFRFALATEELKDDTE